MVSVKTKAAAIVIAAALCLGVPGCALRPVAETFQPCGGFYCDDFCGDRRAYFGEGVYDYGCYYYYPYYDEDYYLFDAPAEYCWPDGGWVYE